MTRIREILQNYLFFGVVFAIFLVVFVMFLLIVTHMKNKKRIYFYGLLVGLNNREIFSLSLIILNALFLMYTLVMKIELSMPIIFISMVMVLFSFLIINSPMHFIVNGGINIVNLALIYLAGLVNTLRVDNDSTAYYVLQIMMNVFGLLFYLFTALKFVKNIHKKEIVYEENN